MKTDGSGPDSIDAGAIGTNRLAENRQKAGSRHKVLLASFVLSDMKLTLPNRFAVDPYNYRDVPINAFRGGWFQWERIWIPTKSSFSGCGMANGCLEPELL